MQPRAEACKDQLAELNQYVRVNLVESINDNLLREFKCVVVTEASEEMRMYLSDFCHANGICYIQGLLRGLFASVFCDFGEAFTVHDTTGEEPATSMIVSIEADVEDALVTVSDDSRHGLETGDFVTFNEIKGEMGNALNGCEARRVTVKSPYTFTIGSTKGLGAYGGDGNAVQVKQPATLSFKSMRDALNSPGEFLISDFSKFDRPALLHAGFRALDSFSSSVEGGHLPRPGAMEDANKVLEFSRKYGVSEEDAADDSRAATIIRMLSCGARGDLPPMAAAIGGIVGQEVLKACSGKFTPIRQWFYLDAVECLPSADGGGWPLPEEAYAPRGSRYDSQAAVFGWEFVERLRKLSYFLVGAGAIGCEMLKNWALMGVASSGDAAVHVTDMDTIEKSNLNRQFLFRPKDVGSAKSSTAAAAVAAMNPEMRVQAHEDKVAPETEDVFGDEFFGGLDGVCTALDNVEARLYVDSRCLYYGKPMLESGTLGTKGNTQLVLPRMTENYGASRDPPEKSIPICTLKNFPYQIEHTIQWARDFFEGTFSQAALDVNSYLSDSQWLAQLDSQQNTKIDTLKRLHSSLVKDRPTTFDECVQWARMQFEELFNWNPRQLLHNFPPSTVTSSGQPFWSGHKRQPRGLNFDQNDSVMASFIVAAANLRAFNYGIRGTRDPSVFLSALATTHIPEWQPKSGLKIAANDKEAKEMEEQGSSSIVDTDKVAADIIKAIPEPGSLAGFRLQIAEFEKDDDTNFHMEFITACSNLRARNYSIEEASLHKTKLIAGKIIPAIATTTALVTGLVCLELYKIVQGKKIEDFRNVFVNLALPLLAMSEPMPVESTTIMTKDGEWSWSVWDSIEINTPNMTLQQFVDYIEEQYCCEVQMISHGVTIIHSFFFPPKKTKERMSMSMEKIVEQFALKRPLVSDDKFLTFEVCAVDEEDEDVDLPYVRYSADVPK